MANSVYNARIRKMVFSSRLTRAFLLLLLILLIAIPGSASQWQVPSAQLARKIAAVTGPGAVHLNLVNRSSVAQASVDEIRRTLMSELSAQGLHFVEAEQAAASVDVTLSENLENFILIAEIHQGTNEPAIIMVTLARTESSIGEHAPAAVAVRKALLWSDESPILDLVILNANPQHMIALEPESIVFYVMNNGHWQQEQSLPMAHAHPWPRDLRGRLLLRRDHLFDAYLPGVYCRSAKPGMMECHPSDDPWPLSADQPPLNGFYAQARNFFTGVLSPGVQKQTTTAPFYSAAALPRDKYTLWFFAGVDGQVRTLDGMTDQVAPKLNWGSDLASVHSGCGSGWQILAAGANVTSSDSVSAYEVPDREIIASSQALDMGGKITALWTDSEGSGAIAITKNDSNRYEAYRLTVTCGQ